MEMIQSPRAEIEPGYPLSYPGLLKQRTLSTYREIISSNPKNFSLTVFNLINL